MIVKRVLDVLVSAVLLLLLTPVLLGIALLVWVDGPGGVLYRQERVGLGRVPFTMLKFRSMRVDADRVGPLVTVGRDPRVTRIGRFLRATRLDELPQLWNVLRGDMSLVGPRPEVPRYVAAYPAAAAAAIFSVRPGVTEQGTLEFRNEAEMLAGADNPERYYVETILPIKVEAAERYVRSRSLLGDLHIMLRTIGALVPQRSVHRVTTEER